MREDLEQFIPHIIELHKQEQGEVFDWSDLRRKMPSFPKQDWAQVKLAMVRMGVLELVGGNNDARTRLLLHNFDLEEYKQLQNIKREREQIDYKLLKAQLEDFPRVKSRANWALFWAAVAAAATVASVIIQVYTNKK